MPKWCRMAHQRWREAGMTCAVTLRRLWSLLNLGLGVPAEARCPRASLIPVPGSLHTGDPNADARYYPHG